MYWLFVDFVDWDGDFASFLPWVVGGIGSIPAVFNFMCFLAGVAFGFLGFDASP